MLAFYLVTYQPLKYREYVYPAWGQAIGWLMTLSSLSLIPTVMIYKLMNTTGSIKEVNINCQYVRRRSQVNSEDGSVHHIGEKLRISLNFPSIIFLSSITIVIVHLSPSGRRLWWPSTLTEKYWKIYAAMLKKKIKMMNLKTRNL